MHLDIRCETCGTHRTEADKDFHPMQVLSGQPCGWFSDEGEEICGRCVDMLIFTAHN